MTLDKLIENIKHYYLEVNMSVSEVAKNTGLNCNQIRYLIKKHNLFKMNDYNRGLSRQERHEYYLKSIEPAKQLYESGLSAKQVSKITGFTQDKIRKCAKDFNWKHTDEQKYHIQLEASKQRMKTYQERYGYTHASRDPKRIAMRMNTYFERTGYTHNMRNPKCKQLRVENNIKKYGVQNTSQVPEIQARIQSTKRKTGVFKKSKEEDTVYEMLKPVFPDIIRQYQESRYPYACDFYIPSKDLFIEYQGYCSHGHNKCHEPYDPTNPKHIKKVKELQRKADGYDLISGNVRSKPGQQYRYYIKVWTEIDPLKRQIAKNNNLNFIEFWNLSDVQTWLSTII